MADQPLPDRGLAGFAHGVLDRLTAIKLHVGSLRLHLKQGAIAPELIETHLTHIEDEIDAAAALAQDVQARERGSK